MSLVFSTTCRHVATGIGATLAVPVSLGAAADATPSPSTDAASSLVATISGRAGTLRERLADVIATARDLPRLLAAAGAWLGEEGNRRAVETTIALAAVVLVTGVVLELLSRLLLRRAGLTGEAGHAASAGKLARMFIRLTVDLFAIAAFTTGSMGALLTLYDHDDAIFPIMLPLLAAVVTLRLIAAAARALFASRAAEARLLPVDDATTARLYRHVIVLAGLLVVFRLVHELLGEAGEGMRGLIALGMIWLFALALSISLWRCRDLIARYFRPGPAAAGRAASIRDVLATRLHALAFGYVVLAAVAASFVSWRRGASSPVRSSPPLPSSSPSRLRTGWQGRALAASFACCRLQPQPP